MSTLATPYASLLGLRVRVYRNLHNGLFSIQHRGCVIAHLAQLTLSGVTFQVQPAGRAKVLATRTKNVHAYVTGTITGRAELCDTNPVARVTYNPYRAGHFTNPAGDYVHSALGAEITATGIWIY